MAAKQLSGSRMTALLALAILASDLGINARAATSTFVQTGTASRSWNGSTNWATGDLTTAPTSGSGPVPSAPGDVAIFQQLILPPGTSNSTVSLNQVNETVGVLTVRDTTNTATLTISTATTGTPGILIFDNNGSAAQLNESGGDDTNSSRLRITAPVQLNSSLIVNQTHNPSKNTATEIAGQLTGGAGITITKTGVGSFQLGYNNAADRVGYFLGNVDVQQGLLRIIDTNGTTENNFMLSKSNGVYVHDGAQMQLGNSISDWGLGANGANPDGLAVLTLEGIGDTSNPSAPLPEGALRFDEASATPFNCTIDSPIMLATTSRIYVSVNTVAGVLTQEVRGTGTAGLNKGGSGVLKLTTTSVNGNTYAGTTNVSKGALVVNNTVATASGVGSGSVNVTDSGSGAILAGNGYIGTSAAPSNVSFVGAANAIGAALFPGDLDPALSTPFVASKPGILTIHGNLSFDALSSLNVDITGTTVGTQYDQVSEHGTVTLGGAGLNINLGSYSPTGTETFSLIDNAGAQAVVGTFGALNGTAGSYAEGAVITLGSATYKLTYAGGANHNDVELIGTAAPTGVPGDFNGNGVVDMADYVLWRNGGPLQNEISDVGVVNAQDYLDWRANFGNTHGSGSSALGQSTSVPEPTACLLAMIGLVASLTGTRKR